MLLAVSMVATMLITGISAAEIGKTETGYTPTGTPINNASDFAAMSANGNYYLNADITISATWNGGNAVSTTATSNTAFTGTFDGNGHTVTTTVPLFATLSGTVKNLTIEGSVASLDITFDSNTCTAALAAYAKGAVTVENVCNKANIASTKTSAGIIAIADTYGNGPLVIKNCQNDGNIESTKKAGGILGFTTGADVTVEDCVNNGNVTCTGDEQYAYVGGVVGHFAKTSSPYPTAADAWLVMRNCVNNGKVKLYRGYCAGVLGFSYGHIELFSCVNNGEIENIDHADGKAAGIYCASSTRDSVCSIYIKDCVNYGTIKGTYHAAGIAAFLGNGAAESSTYNYTIKHCANFGEIILNPNKLTPSSYYRASGIAAYAYGGSSGNSVTECLNAGNIVADVTSSKVAHIGGIIGYVNGNAYTLKNNINVGTITLNGTPGATPNVGMIAYNSTTKTPLTNTANNYTIDGGSIPSILYASTLAETNVTVITARQIETGELVYTANQNAGKEIFFQKIGTDAVPTIVPDGTNRVGAAGDAYHNVSGMPENDEEEDLPQKPGASTPETPTEPTDIVPIVIPENTVTLPAAGNVGKVDANYKPEGTPVTSAAEFAAMSASGNYYLANDITISASYANAFTGTFDGNGKTITTTVALFKTFNGTIKNLTIEGEVKATTTNNAAIAMETTLGVKADNVYNKANVLGGKHVGAFVGHAATDADTRIVNSRNDGSITGTMNVGGFGGYAENYVFYIENSVNTGAVTATETSADSYAGGIIGRFGKDKAVAFSSFCKILNCQNYGRVKSVANYAAGLLAYLSGFADIDGCTNYATITCDAGVAAGLLAKSSSTAGSSAMQIEFSKNYGNIGGGGNTAGIVGSLGSATVESYYIFNAMYCENYGDIYAVTQAGSTGTFYVGGIAGYSYGGSSPNGITHCLNAGNITVDNTKTSRKCYVGGISGYVNASIFHFKNNVSATKSITTTGTVTVKTVLIYNKATTTTETANNFALAVGSIPLMRIDTSTNVAENLAKAVTEAQLASGEVTHAINTYVGGDAAFQNLGEDKYPSFDRTHKLVVKNADGTYANAERPVTPPESENTTVPGGETTTAPTGDVTTNTPDPENTTATPESTTKAPDTEANAEKSCGGFALTAQIITILGAGITVVAFKKKN